MSRIPVTVRIAVLTILLLLGVGFTLVQLSALPVAHTTTAHPLVCGGWNVPPCD